MMGSITASMRANAVMKREFYDVDRQSLLQFSAAGGRKILIQTPLHLADVC